MGYLKKKKKVKRTPLFQSLAHWSSVKQNVTTFWSYFKSQTMNGEALKGSWCRHAVMLAAYWDICKYGIICGCTFYIILLNSRAWAWRKETVLGKWDAGRELTAAVMWSQFALNERECAWSSAYQVWPHAKSWEWWQCDLTLECVELLRFRLVRSYWLYPQHHCWTWMRLRLTASISGGGPNLSGHLFVPRTRFQFSVIHAVL